MNYKKICIVFAVFVILTMSFTYSYAGILDDILGQGGNFFNPSNAASQGTLGTKIVDYLNVSGGIVDAIKTVGYLVFAIVTVALGLKYVWSGVEGKSEVKETLPTFVVGVIFFYLADKLYAVFSGSFQSIFNVPNITFNTISGSIVGTIYYLVNIGTIAGIIFIGLKYMSSPADKKADIKANLLPMAIGLIFVYCSTQVLTFFINAANQAL